uniref:Vitamin B12 transporter n=1 Tax=Candidatus Kentrum sp. FW TaxID=2126338 RepID=A0A450SNR8_9GAMM|nr:MAG: vitamin B12 transporter [Candidatus Kentron sp. FW]
MSCFHRIHGPAPMASARPAASGHDNPSLPVHFRPRHLSAFTAALLFATALSAFAEEGRVVHSLDAMVVTATRVETAAIDVPVNTEIITEEQIELSGVTHVGDLIGKYITGHYHRYNGLLAPVGMRGFRTESHGDDIKGHVLLLVDGHRIGTGNAAKINTDRIERIEITKGPASALYGSATMGGVINLITKKGEGPLVGTLAAEYGSFQYYKASVSGGGEINDRVRFHATVSQEGVDDYEGPEFGTVFNTGETKKNIGGNVVFTLDRNHEIRIGGNYADLTGEFPSWESGTYSSYDEDTRKDYDKSHVYADVEYNGDFMDDKLHARTLAYYLRDRNHWRYGADDPELDQAKYTDTTLGVDQQLAWDVTPWNTLLVGFNFEHLEKEGTGVSGGLPAAPYTPNMEYDSQAFFIQGSLDLWDNRVNIIASGRYDRFDVSTLKPTEVTLADFNEREESYSNFSPKLGVGVKFLDERLRLRANVGEGFKSPSADQLSADYTHGTSRYVGNPDLGPETSWSWDVGIDVFHDDVTLKLGYFHTDFEDKIVSASGTLPNGDPIRTWENHGNATIAGFEMNIEWWMGETFGWPVDVSLWSNAAVNTKRDDEETGKDLLYISDYELKSGLIVNWGDWGGQLNHVLVGPQWITNFDTYADEKKGSFDFWDLTVRYEPFDNFQLQASVLNLFDDRVEWARGYLMPERNYRVGVSYNF